MEVADEVDALTVDQLGMRALLDSAVSGYARRNETSEHLSMSARWRAGSRGERIDAKYVQKNWLPLDALEGVIGEAFRGMSPPAFVVDGLRYVPQHDYECFVGHVLAAQRLVEAEARERGKKSEHDRQRMAVRQSVVYFIQGEPGTEIKIGYTKDLAGRLTALQSSRKDRLRVLAFVRGHRSKEASMHRRFAHLREHGEWFRAEPELLSYIDEHATKVVPK